MQHVPLSPAKSLPQSILTARHLHLAQVQV
jgi:hypothetical protein